MASLANFVRHSVPRIIKSTVRTRHLTNSAPFSNKKEINVTFIRQGGKKFTTKGQVGDTFLNVVVKNGLEIEGYGACEGTLTCSTCHIIFNQKDYDRIQSQPQDEENDMLELAQDTTPTSRLGCQVTLTEDMDGITVEVPEIANDVYERLPNK